MKQFVEIPFADIRLRDRIKIRFLHSQNGNLHFVELTAYVSIRDGNSILVTAVTDLTTEVEDETRVNSIKHGDHVISANRTLCVWKEVSV